MNRKALWIGLAAVAVVAAIIAGLMFFAPGKPTKSAQAVVQSQQPSTAAADVTPYTFASNSSQADVSLKLPAMLSEEPALHARLYAEGVKDLKGFVEGAAAAHAEDTSDTTPYAKNVSWTEAADTPKLLSLREETLEFTGGAHPNTTLQALLWDKALKRPLQPQALFKPGADLSKLDAAICNSLTATKKKRLGADFTAAGDATWRCPHWSESAFVLAPSTQAGKAGGLTFLFSPCTVGACVEGPYQATVPLAAFQSALAPAYADEFAGVPGKPPASAPASTTVAAKP